MMMIKKFDFTKSDIKNELVEVSRSKDLIDYASFMLVDPITEIKFPEFDKPFFDRMDATLKHILYQFKEGWITSPRQVFYSSNECLTTIQFVFRLDTVEMNIFQRSSNVNNLKEDVQFLNWFLKENFHGIETHLNIFVSMPHEFTNKKTKVD